MILSDGEIQEAIRLQHIIIEPPPDDSQYSPSALDLTLGDELHQLKTIKELQADDPLGAERSLVINLAALDINAILQRYTNPVPGEQDGSFILHPNNFVLGITRERVTLPRESKIAARVDGRSTPARLGLVVHMTAPTIHCGFTGRIVLEMYNFGNFSLRLMPGKLAICQLIFERLGEVPGRSLTSVHQDQKTVIR